MTTAIIIGDTHFKVDNIKEVDLFIEKVTEVVKDKNPDFVVLLGDTLDTHERIHTIPLNRAYKFINNIRKFSSVFVLVGNHDMINHSQYLNDNHWLNALKEWENVTIVDKAIVENIDGYDFAFCPYVANGRFEEALNTVYEQWKEAVCVFAHQEFYGCKMGAFNSVDGDKWSLECPNVISGHIHLNQKPQDNIYYPGSSLPVAFGESNKNIIAYVTFGEEKSYELEEIDLELPKKKILYVNIDDINEFNVPEETEDKIKVSVSGLYEDFKTFKGTSKYKDLISKGVKVIFKPKRIEKKLKKETLKNNIENNPNDFTTIIQDIIEQERNSYLLEAYELVFNNKEINAEDILLI